ncbi:hypothetical protein K0M31_006326, partial [Melipona bicolor]
MIKIRIVDANLTKKQKEEFSTRTDEISGEKDELIKYCQVEDGGITATRATTARWQPPLPPLRGEGWRSADDKRCQGCCRRRLTRTGSHPSSTIHFEAPVSRETDRTTFAR